MAESGFQVVAFDCDGVMFDTAEANHAFYNHILSHFNRPPLTPEQFRLVQMHTVEVSLGLLFDDPETLAAADAFRQAMSYLPFIEHMQIEPELKPLLSDLRPGYHTAIATNRTTTMDRVLSVFGLDSYFDLVVTALDVPAPKPAPDQLHKISAHFKVSAGQILYIGDSELDQQAARSAGVVFAAYANPGLDADYHIQSLKQIRPILHMA